MKSSYEQELDYLLSSPRRARANRKRIEELRQILAEIDTQRLVTGNKLKIDWSGITNGEGL